MPQYTVQIPERYRDLFPGLAPHDRAHSQITILSDTEGGVAYQIAREVEGLSWGAVSEFPTKETAIPIGQELTQALSPAPRDPGLNIDTQFGTINLPMRGPLAAPFSTSPAEHLAQFPAFANVFAEGMDGGFDASTLFDVAGGYGPTTPSPEVPEVPAGIGSSAFMIELQNARRIEREKLVKIWDKDPDLKAEINAALRVAHEKEKTTDVSGVMTVNELGASQVLGELRTWDEVAREYKGKELITEGPLQGSINPALLAAINFAYQQNGFISTQQVAVIKAEADKAMVADRIASDLAVATQQGKDETAIAKLRRDGDVDIANAQAAVEQTRFVTQQNLETLRVNAQLMQGTEQHDQIMKQLGLQESQRSNEYKIQNAQIEAAAEEGLRRYNLNEAEGLRRFEVQMKELTDRAATGDLQFTVEMEQLGQQFAIEMEQLANLRAESAEQAAAAQTAFAGEAEKTQLRFEQQKLQDEQNFQLQLDQQQKDLEQAQLNFTVQVERDKITAQTNKQIAVIQREQAGNTDEINRQIAQRRSEEREQLALLDQLTTLGVGAQQLEATLAGFTAQEYAAQQAATAQTTAATTQAGAVTEAAATTAAAAGPFGFLAQEGLSDAQLAARQTQLADIQQQQFNPFDLSTQQFQELQTLQARAGATPFGAITTAPTEGQTYTDLLGLQQAQAAQGPFQAAELGQQMGDISTILRGGLTPEQQVSLAQAPGNPFGLTPQQQIDLQGTLARGGNTAVQQQILAESLARGGNTAVQQQILAESLARGGLSVEQQSALAGLQARGGITEENEFMALQQSLARGGLTPTQRLTEVQAGAAPQNMANYLNFIGNPAAVGFAGQSGFLQNMADSPEGNLPASLFGLNVPQNAPTVPTNPTMADLTDLTDEQLGFYQGQQAAQNYQTPSQIFQQAQMVTPQGV